MEPIWFFTYLCLALCVVALMSRIYISYQKYKRDINHFKGTQVELAEKIRAFDQQKQTLEPHLKEAKKRYKKYLEEQDTDA